MSDNGKSGQVRHQSDGRIFRIIIDNVAKRNSFTPEMMEQFSDALTEFARDDDWWVAVVSAEGEHFTAGLDMPKFFGPGASAKPPRPESLDPFALRNRTVKPIVTAVQGITYTIGIEMMLAGDIVVAADNVRFCQMESRRGIAPLGGAHFRFLTRTGWGNAMYHLMLCDEFGAERARQLGLVQEVVPAGKQLERAIEIANAICKNAPLGIRAMKEAALKYIAANERAAVDAIATVRERVMNSDDAREGIRSFVERRAANFQGK
jgi:enoyl-CoA hydratase/carnithine racemase